MEFVDLQAVVPEGTASTVPDALTMVEMAVLANNTTAPLLRWADNQTGGGGARRARVYARSSGSMTNIWTTEGTCTYGGPATGYTRTRAKATCTSSAAGWRFDVTTCGHDEDHPWTTYTDRYSTRTASTSYSLWRAGRDGWAVCDDTGYREVAEFVRPDPVRKVQEMLAARRAPGIIVGYRKPLPLPQDIREERARETLRRVIGEERYRDYLRTGFVSVRGKDGFHYQMFPGHGFTHVYDCGKLKEKLCVVWRGDFTPTDSLIMRYLLVLNNPGEFWKVAIKHGAMTSRQGFQLRPVVADRSLSDVFQAAKNDPGRTIRRQVQMPVIATG